MDAERFPEGRYSQQPSATTSIARIVGGYNSSRLNEILCSTLFCRPLPILTFDDGGSVSLTA